VNPPVAALRETPVYAPPLEPEVTSRALEPEQIAANDAVDSAQPDFAQLLTVDRNVEWRIFWGEVIALACIVMLTLWALFTARPGG
jgi:hypothetical protein